MNSDKFSRGVQYFRPDTGEAVQRPTEPAPGHPGGPHATDPKQIGATAVGGPVPHQSGPSSTPVAATTPFAGIFYRPAVWHAGTTTGAETPMTSAPEEQAPLADMDPNPNQLPYAPDNVVIDAATVDDEPVIKKFGGKQRLRGFESDDHGPKPRLKRPDTNGDEVGVEDVEIADPGTEPFHDDDDFPVGDLADRHGPDCQRYAPGLMSRSRNAVIFTTKGTS